MAHSDMHTLMQPLLEFNEADKLPKAANRRFVQTLMAYFHFVRIERANLKFVMINEQGQFEYGPAEIAYRQFRQALHALVEAMITPEHELTHYTDLDGWGEFTDKPS